MTDSTQRVLDDIDALVDSFVTNDLTVSDDAMRSTPEPIEKSAKRCDFFGCANPARPGSEDCETHQHAVSCESSNGTQITLTCACGETFGPVGEPNDRRLQNRDDALSLHAKHAAIA